MRDNAEIGHNLEGGSCSGLEINQLPSVLHASRNTTLLRNSPSWPQGELKPTEDPTGYSWTCSNPQHRNSGKLSTMRMEQGIEPRWGSQFITARITQRKIVGSPTQRCYRQNVWTLHKMT